jgi:biopolymer transport protein ExbD
MDLRKLLDDDKVSLQMAPLIDVVFLLLVYFMVTASLVKKEADIAFLLPAQVSQSEPISLPIEVIINIESGGAVVVEGIQFSSADRELMGLASQLQQLRAAAQSSGSPLVITISPKDAVMHHRIVEVMNACAMAEVKNISFNLGT